MDEKFTPEQLRAKLTEGLPRPLKPLPPDIKAEILAKQLPYEEALREYKELMEKGGYPLGASLDEFERTLNESGERG